MKIIYLLLIFLNIGLCSIRANDTLRLEHLKQQLDLAVSADSAFLTEIDISTGQLELADLLRNVAKVSGVNLSVRTGTQQMVNCNFNRARVVDLLLFLCREYHMELSVMGNILSIFPETPVAPKPPEIVVTYNRESGGLSCDFTNASLILVVRKITDLSGSNIMVPPPLYNNKVSAFFKEMPLKEAMQNLAMLNNLDITCDKQGIWSFIGREEPVAGGKKGGYTPRRASSSEQLVIDSLGRITAMITNGNLNDILREVCEKLKLNYFFITPVNQQSSVFIRALELPVFLNLLFTGTAYSWQEEGGIYLFGTAGKESQLTTTRLVPMLHRTVNKVVELIPTAIKNGVQVQVFPDQNSLILCGDQRQVARIEYFLKSIDKSVPLITIEVMIVDATRNVIQESGISMGLGDAPVKSSGTLSPGVNMSLNSSSINKLINSFNGFGSINLGRVTPDFYMNLKFLEEAGNIELRSTPKLATLNGHEATLKSGETKYYKEVQNNIIGSQNPMQSESYSWKNVEANLTLKIVPFVSEHNHLTLEIEIEQSEFMPREEKDAPPGTSTRSFKSIIKMENQEMVLLGGIERNSKNKTSSGLPFIARVPVLKWLLGSSTNNKSSHKLNVFIKPTVVE